MLTQRRHARPFRQILADETIGIFITAPLPRMIRTGEVKERLRPRFDLLVVVELRAVVSSDGLERALVTVDQPDDSPVERGGRPVGQLADQQ